MCEGAAGTKAARRVAALAQTSGWPRAMCEFTPRAMRERRVDEAQCERHRRIRQAAEVAGRAIVAAVRAATTCSHMCEWWVVGMVGGNDLLSYVRGRGRGGTGEG